MLGLGKGESAKGSARGALGGELCTRLIGHVARWGSVTAIASRACEPRVFASPAAHRDGSHPGSQRARLPHRPAAKRGARAPRRPYGNPAARDVEIIERLKVIRDISTIRELCKLAALPTHTPDISHLIYLRLHSFSSSPHHCLGRMHTRLNHHCLNR